MAKKKKTNAMRTLDRMKIKYDVIEYAIDDGGIGGLRVAEKTGQRPETVFKTLVAHKEDGSFCVFCLPVTRVLDLKKAARAAGAKRIRMIPMKDLLPNTGYVHGGCSPVGMKKSYPTWIDQSAEDLEVICVSGGARGIQVKLPVEALKGIVGAKVADLSDGESETEAKEYQL